MRALYTDALLPLLKNSTKSTVTYPCALRHDMRYTTKATWLISKQKVVELELQLNAFDSVARRNLRDKRMSKEPKVLE